MSELIIITNIPEINLYTFVIDEKVEKTTSTKLLLKETKEEYCSLLNKMSK